MTVIDIRGTHGSGKSWIILQLLQEYKSEEIVEDGNQIGYHLPDFDAAIVGRYRARCGGCDVVRTADEVVRRVRLFHSRYKHVLLEGIVVAHTFKRYGELARELGDYVFCFLDTPLRKCIARVRMRRRAAGNYKEFNPTECVSNYYRIWERVRQRCDDDNLQTVVLSWKDPMPPIMEILEHALG